MCHTGRSSDMNTTISTNPVWRVTNIAKFSMVSAYSIIALFGITGNISVIYYFKAVRHRRNSSNTFIISLAVADLLASFFIPLLMIRDLLSFNNWEFGQIGCKIIPSISPLTMLASSFNMMVISIDRLRYGHIFSHISFYVPVLLELCGSSEMPPVNSIGNISSAQRRGWHVPKNKDTMHNANNSLWCCNVTLCLSAKVHPYFFKKCPLQLVRNA